MYCLTTLYQIYRLGSWYINSCWWWGTAWRAWYWNRTRTWTKWGIRNGNRIVTWRAGDFTRYN